MDTNNLAPPGVISLGSLFDGIGGFPLAGSFFGIQPLWASEIIPQAISITKRHFPQMQHVGDITKLDGAALPPTQIVTFGSPCQDLSTAGKRAGIGGSRSNLFYEAIRIIDEMRCATNETFPKYAVWENVPGALSSGRPRGADFAAMLSAFAKTEIPIPESGGWANAGMARGDGVAVAWRVLNAQYHGVPQRRCRLFLVASFGAGCPGEILFVEEGLRRHLATGGQARQGATAHAAGGLGSAMPGGCCGGCCGCGGKCNGGCAGCCGKCNGRCNGDGGCVSAIAFAANQRDEARDLGGASGALQAQPGMKQQTFVAQAASAGQSAPNCLTPWDVQSRRVHTESGAWPALYGADGGGHGYAATLGASCCGGACPCGGVHCLNPWETQQSRVFREDGASPTLAGADGGGGRNPGGLVAAFLGGASAKARRIGYSEAVSLTLKSEACGFNAPCLCEPKLARTLTARGDGSPNVDGGPNVIATNATAVSADNNQGGMIVVGVHQNQAGDVSVSETAYTLATNSNATGRNAPLVAHVNVLGCCNCGDCQSNVHPDVAGTLCASGAGLSRPAGMASEPDLCVAYALAGNMLGRQDRNGPNGSGVRENLSFTLNATDVQGVAATHGGAVDAQGGAAANPMDGEPIPIHDRATRHQGGGGTRNGDGCGNGLGVGKPGDPAPTVTAGRSAQKALTAQ